MDDSEFQRLLNAEPPITIIGCRRRFFLILGLGTVALAMGLLIAFAPFQSSHNPFIFFMIATPLLGFAIGGIANPSKIKLFLGRDFFITIPGPYAPESLYYWKNISEVKAGKNNVIYFNDSADHSSTARFNHTWAGFDASFVNYYDITNRQLVQLLNHWRERALKNG